MQSGANLLVERLSARDRRLLLGCAELCRLEIDAILCKVGTPQRFVYFPVDGFISLVAPVSKHPPLDIALIGRDGMLGATTLLGVQEPPLQAVVRGVGNALRIGVKEFKKLHQGSVALHRLQNRYLFLQLSQFASAAACSHFHEVEPRLAKWLLMLHERVSGNQLRLTHQSLADMLGVRRSAVTIAAGALQRKGAITYARGDIAVLDRKPLEDSSCECYQSDLASHARLLEKMK